MNPNYAARIKEEIDKLLKFEFIRPVKQATWLSLIVVVPKKNGIIRVCVDYHKLNVVQSQTPSLCRLRMYSFLDGFSGYNQIHMHPDNQEKTAFLIDWGVFMAVVMMFGLKIGPATFQHIIAEIFGDFFPALMQVFLNDIAVYGT